MDGRCDDEISNKTPATIIGMIERAFIQFSFPRSCVGTPIASYVDLVPTKIVGTSGEILSRPHASAWERLLLLESKEDRDGEQDRVHRPSILNKMNIISRLIERILIIIQGKI